MASPSLVRRKSPLRGLFRRNGKPLFASLSARVFRLDSDFIGGLRPSKPPEKGCARTLRGAAAWPLPLSPFSSRHDGTETI